MHAASYQHRTSLSRAAAQQRCFPSAVHSLRSGCRNLRRSTAVAGVKKQFSSFDDMLSNSEVPVLVDFYAVSGTM